MVCSSSTGKPTRCLKTVVLGVEELAGLGQRVDVGQQFFVFGRNLLVLVQQGLDFGLGRLELLVTLPHAGPRSFVVRMPGRWPVAAAPSP